MEAGSVETLRTEGFSSGGSGDELYLGDAIRFFLDAKRAGGRSPRTLDEYRKKLDLFQRWAAAHCLGEGEVDLPVGLIGADEVEAYAVHMRRRGLSDSSRKNHLAVLGSMFDVLRRRRGVPDPTEELDEWRFHEKAPRRSYLTEREAGMLLTTIEHAAGEAKEAAGGRERRGGRPPAVLSALARRDHAAFSVMLYAGLRIEEAAALRVEDLHFTRGAEAVRVARGKGNKERLVPMHARLRRSLKGYLAERAVLARGASSHAEPPDLFLNERGSRVSENTLRRRFYGWVRRSRLAKTGLTPHDLRRTFATWFLRKNRGRLVELADLLGQSDLSQIKKYALSDEELARTGVGRL
jgi:integrase/recombinase XerD